MFPPKHRITRISISYKDFNGGSCVGEIDILDILAPHVLVIFKTLFECSFPIYSILPMDEFAFDDDKSMAANNTSGYNPRYIPGTDRLSLHAYGLAIDINPRENPYIVNGIVHPAEGNAYLDRHKNVQGMIEPIVPLFKEYGFIWGGDWTTTIDYHHFQMPRLFAVFLLSMDASCGKIWLDWYVSAEDNIRNDFIILLPKLLSVEKKTLLNIMEQGISVPSLAETLNDK